MAREFKTILDEVAEMFEKQGHSFHRASLSDDRIDFGMPKIKQEFAESQAMVSRLNNLPVDGRKTQDPTVPPNNEKSKQLKLKPSSTIQSAAYWPTKEYLLVSFKSGHTYSYEAVPRLTVDFWQAASSCGSFFYHNIRMSYNYQKMG